LAGLAWPDWSALALLGAPSSARSASSSWIPLRLDIGAAEATELGQAARERFLSQLGGFVAIATQAQNGVEQAVLVQQHKLPVGRPVTGLRPPEHHHVRAIGLTGLTSLVGGGAV